MEERLFKSFNDPPFDVVVRSRWKLQVEQKHIQSYIAAVPLKASSCMIAHVQVTDKGKVVVLLYLSDVNNFVQLHEEPLDGIINLPNFPLGDTDPR